MPAVDRRQDQPATRFQPRAQVSERRGWIGEMLHREARQDHVERARREGIGLRAQVDRRELVQVGQGVRRRCMDVRADEPSDTRSVGGQGRCAAAACVQRDDLLGRSRRPRERPVQGFVDQFPCGRSDSTPGKDRRSAGSPHHAVAVLASVTPCDSSQRSASMAAFEPSPAAVTACRYR